ncbi:hypothetical protein CDL15_Pgr023385 [Punica granatum]|uniref:Uncharacterized protein n=1 Tax=Punica granatum TaxID=22663 RepID=A0A218Y3B8_PUNGR|nr:hypothetical protein CDL15_Pgr023385 [Punica granatum]
MFEKSSQVVLPMTRAVDGDPWLVLVELPSPLRGCTQLFSHCAMLPVASDILSGQGWSQDFHPGGKNVI